MTNNPGVALYMDPVSRHFLGDRLFDISHNSHSGDRMNAPYAYVRDILESRGVAVHTADLMPDKPNGTKNVYVSFGIRKNYRKVARRGDSVLSAFFATECPIVEPDLYRELPQVQRHFNRVFSWSDSPSLEVFTGCPLPLRQFRWPQAFDTVHEEIWRRDDRGFLVMINTNKLPKLYDRELYTERLRAIEYFGRTGDIDLYGVGWDGPPFQMGRTFVPGTVRKLHRSLMRQWQRVRPDPLLSAAQRVYHGPVATKAEILGKYKFALCFENMVLKGWITEKIFDCFFAGTVPIYWGTPDIEDLIPPECFIDMRGFANYGELRTYLKSLGDAEIGRYRQNARAFLESPGFRPFSKEAFADHFVRIIEEDTGVRIR
jgi:hypothetical protein